MPSWYLVFGRRVSVEATVYVSVGLVTALVLGLAVSSVRATRACQRLGYREAIQWPDVTYCVTRHDGTDVLVPLTPATRRLP